MDDPQEIATFTRMEDSTREGCQIVARAEEGFAGIFEDVGTDDHIVCVAHRIQSSERFQLAGRDIDQTNRFTSCAGLLQSYSQQFAHGGVIFLVKATHTNVSAIHPLGQLGKFRDVNDESVKIRGEIPQSQQLGRGAAIQVIFQPIAPLKTVLAQQRRHRFHFLRPLGRRHDDGDVVHPHFFPGLHQGLQFKQDGVLVIQIGVTGGAAGTDERISFLQAERFAADKPVQISAGSIGQQRPNGTGID